MKTPTVRAKCKLEYKGLHESEITTAVYAYAKRYDKNVYHIAGEAISDKDFDKHFDIVND